MILKINLKNFKCFEDESINLAPLTLLSGLNGMGKSTIIQSLLLLRQSYYDNVISKGVSLNGDLIKIGTGRDLLYERAKEEYISIGIEVENDKVNKWELEYDRESNFLHISSSSLEVSFKEINIFTDQFEYLCAERLGPRSSFKKSNFNVVEHRQLGIQGEFAQHYLHVYGQEKISNMKVKKEEVETLNLINQVQGWMNAISPGLRIETSDYSEADLIGMQYRFADNKEFTNEYRPTNVGFGITYVLPVVIALLKAKEGDIVIIENPGAHLHPQGQREIGELIARVCSGGVQVILETHSDHILNGIRLSVRKNLIDNKDIKLHFFNKIPVRGTSIHKITNPNIKKDGRLDKWPEGFFDEWDKALNEFF